ncbi:hypothetical protein D3O61_23500 [Vibrio vulnificus]|nr:hypothetical protein [Vibrio vulnificus]
MKARFLPPRDNYSGNLLWNKEAFSDKSQEISLSINKLRDMGYWASAFPEGDGVTFNFYDSTKTSEEMFDDFRLSFNWIEIERANSLDSNTELAELESDDRTIKCIVIVPLEKIYIQKTITLGKYEFFCRRELDPEPYERFADFDCEYVQFEEELNYKDLLRLNKTFDHNDYVINKCLSIAEHALDLVRYSHSSFKVREFTPNPAGQMSDGFFSVNIIPLGQTHLKPFKLSGISRPISVSNNWLGPQVDGFYAPAINYLSFIYSEDINNEIANSVVSALRSCRQSFYSIGTESQFLNLVFTLDGLTDPEWSGWKHRTYIAALLSQGCPEVFEKKLEMYDMLYTDVRNKLVHEGKDFYQFDVDPDEACETIFSYIKDVIDLIAIETFNSKSEMKDYATDLLRKPEYISKYTNVVNVVSAARGKNPQIPTW